MSKKKNKNTENTIAAGYTLDYISGKQIKETKKELVRQRVVRALICLTIYPIYHRISFLRIVFVSKKNWAVAALELFTKCLTPWEMWYGLLNW